jgi:pimeloyl-ACP methyl ester carboxylesterase
LAIATKVGVARRALFVPLSRIWPPPFAPVSGDAWKSNISRISRRGERLACVLQMASGYESNIPRFPRLGDFRRRRSGGPPVPPELPPGATGVVSGRGELFYRYSGGEKTPVLLLHGWTVTGDVSWARMYRPLRDAGYPVIWLDNRGHGRGIRETGKFRLADCAADAEALLELLGIERAIVVGYSMGGNIAQLIAREHPERVAGLVLSATTREWGGWRLRLQWRMMIFLRLVLSAFPYWVWRMVVARAADDPQHAEWMAGELIRGSGRDIAEAGREMKRFDSREWVGQLEMPAAVIVTAKDRDCPPQKQRELAVALGATSWEVPGAHLSVSDPRYAEPLLEALARVDS